MSTARSDKFQATLKAAVGKILRPLVGILIRNGVDCVSFEEEVRRTYVAVALDEFSLEGRKPTASRAATITGLSRKEVARLQKLQQQTEEPSLMSHNRAATVVAGWVRDPDFQNGLAQPRPLSMADTAGGFPALVKRYSRDVTPRAVLDELARSGTVRILPDGRAELTARSYVPTSDDLAKLEILGTDVHYLLSTIGHNLARGDVDPRYQRKVLYDDLPADYIEKFRALAAQRCQELLEELDAELAAHDGLPNSGDQAGERVVAGVGMFYFEEPADANTTDASKGES